MGENNIKVGNLIRKLLKACCILIFTLFKGITKTNSNMILIDSWYGKKLESDLLYIYKELSRTKKEIIVVRNFKENCFSELNGLNTKIIKSNSIKHFYYLAVSGFWIVNTIYYPYLKPKSLTKKILVWHAAGSFKRFGQSILEKKRDVALYQKNGESTSNLIISSASLIELYSYELYINKEKILPFGLPRADYLSFASSVPYTKKKIILYAPTFRDEGKADFYIKLDFRILYQEFKERYMIYVKLHPNSTSMIEFDEEFVFDKSALSIDELMILSDVLITDYSSIVYDYSLLNKPMIFYAHDLEEYVKKCRGFYINYRDFIPGPLVENTEQLVKKIYELEKEWVNHYESKSNMLKSFHVADGKAVERFINYFFG